MHTTLVSLFQRPAKLLAATFAASMLFVAPSASALDERPSATGYWKTIDDETGETKSIVKIYEVDGKLYGRVDKLLLRPGALCDKCEGDDKDKPIEGMVVLWGMSDDDGDGDWTGGKIFDPQKNKTYTCQIWLKDGNLMVRGYIGPFFRTQTWIRSSR